jgi:uncharacterized paraquat-inducible protein A
MQQRTRIRPLHPRIAATFALFPVIVGLEIAVVWMCDRLDRRFDELVAWTPAMLFPGVAFYLGCFLIWKSTICWTPARRFRVFVIVMTSALLLLLVAGVPAMLGASHDWVLFSLLSAGGIISGAAVWLTVCICCDAPEPSRVLCPSCGYDLRGQQECRCPECGEQFTVGELAGGRAADEP